jgi:hypothetical protein
MSFVDPLCIQEEETCKKNDGEASLLETVILGSFDLPYKRLSCGYTKAIDGKYTAI